MVVIENRAKQKLAAGELSLGIGIRQARTVDIAKIAANCGYDWLFIDMEHNSMSIDTAAQICVAALDAGIAPLVRVPGHEPFHASKLLDAGALGIVAPHVNTAEQARRIVANCLFPAAGKRSLPGGLPQVNFNCYPADELIAGINDGVLVVVMIETPEGLANVDEIAATEGVDVLLMGGNDLSAELGIPGQFGDPRLKNAFNRVVEACRRHDKFAGVGGIYDHPLMQYYVEAGARFILSGSDLTFLMAGAKARSGFLRAALPPAEISAPAAAPLPSRIRLDRDGSVLIARLDQPPLNLLTQDLRREIRETVERAGANPSVRAVVLSGGAHFCAGADLKEFEARHDPAIAEQHCRNAQSMALALFSIDKPIIAAIEGACLGGGLELALACDLRIAAAEAKLGLPEIIRGNFPGTGGIWLLERLVGPSRAKRIVLQGGIDTAVSPVFDGVIDERVPAGEALDVALRVAHELCDRSAPSVAAIKRLADAAARREFARYLDVERHEYIAGYQRADVTEGVRAFLEKRSPQWVHA